jgi:hypothetical protein
MVEELVVNTVFIEMCCGALDIFISSAHPLPPPPVTFPPSFEY